MTNEQQVIDKINDRIMVLIIDENVKLTVRDILQDFKNEELEIYKNSLYRNMAETTMLIESIIKIRTCKFEKEESKPKIIEIKSHYWPNTPDLREIKILVDNKVIYSSFMGSQKILELMQQMNYAMQNLIKASLQLST